MRVRRAMRVRAHACLKLQNVRPAECMRTAVGMNEPGGRGIGDKLNKKRGGTDFETADTGGKPHELWHGRASTGLLDSLL